MTLSWRPRRPATVWKDHRASDAARGAARVTPGHRPVANYRRNLPRRALEVASTAPPLATGTRPPDVAGFEALSGAVPARRTPPMKR